jgi:uncharacterized protein (TIGR03382 family)
MRAALLIGLAVLGVALTDAPACADAIDDSSCRAWERWEGHHEGGCRSRISCSVSVGSGAPGAATIGVAIVSAVLLQRRRS